VSVRGRALRHELERLVQEVRIDDLRGRLADGPVAVRHTAYRRSGGRVQLELDDGSALALRLFWPRRAVVSALVSMYVDERVGWIVHARTTDGADVTFYAWLATVTPPGGR
jgi:hypothetical protein